MMSLSSVARAGRRLPRAFARPLSNAAGPLASAAYTDPSRAADPAVLGTPDDLTEAQRHVLHSSLRVDQVGEVAADYIYRGQLAVLKNDPTCGPIIQVCAHAVATLYRPSPAAGNVGPGEEAPRGHAQAPRTARRSADRALGGREGRRFRARRGQRAARP
jgi:hypothetical protein